MDLRSGVTRRSFTKRAFAAVACASVTPYASAALNAADAGGRIDRRALVHRHNVVQTAIDIKSPLSVGNGEFAFTADVTGLQTFTAEYREGMPLATMAQWGFHTAPNPNGFSLETFPLTPDGSAGREVGYLYYEEGKSPHALAPAADYLYSNPGRFNLGRIGMILRDKDGKSPHPTDLTDVRQELDLWSGSIVSTFRVDGEPVHVVTAVDPKEAQLAVRVESPLISAGRLGVLLAFPYASNQFGGDGADWTKPEAHQTSVARTGSNRADFARTLDTDRYHVALEWAGNAALAQHGPHEFHLEVPPDSIERKPGALTFTVSFSPVELPSRRKNCESVLAAARSMWSRFWTTGAAIDLSHSKDPRWQELERRIVLSQYLTRIQSAGSLPPQETGLTCNSWFGKFHLEMHWWHAAHFALWGRHDLLERSLPFYQRILPKARALAKQQGYQGARWPKCVGPSGDPAPSYLESFLIWQQPHPISYAELCYRAAPGPRMLRKYREIVFETAAFMASFVVWDEPRHRYRLGPPLSDAAEIYYQDHDHQWNPTFELAYWRQGLETAQRWRVRLGMERDAAWDHVIANLPPLAIRDGLYVAAETATGTFTEAGRNTSHPCQLAPLGMLDGRMADPAIMRATLLKTLANWEWNNTWGWDYPMMAMTAARVNEPAKAIDILLMQKGKNNYLPNGHNFQIEHLLPLYLPGNGGLLYAVAMMAGGWDGAPKRHAPGFPADGNWTVRSEGFQPAP